MPDSQSRIIFTDDKRAAQAFTLAALESLPGMQDAGDRDGRVLHPLIYPGIWEHPSYGVFKVTPSDIEGMVAAFAAGVPTQLGIPIDERAEHSPNPDGAYGWIKDLVVQDVDGHEGVLCGAIEWTEMGRQKVESQETPFVSAHFILDDKPDPMYGYNCFLFSAAMTARPFFWQQPQLEIAASAYALSANSEATGDNAQPPGGATMEATTARRQIDEARGQAMSDEEWTALSEGVEDFDALIAAEKTKLETEPSGPPAQPPAEPPATTTSEPPRANDTDAVPEPSDDETPPTRAEFNEMRRQMMEMAETTKQAKEVAASANMRLGEATRREEEERESRVRAEIKGIEFDGGRRSIAASATDVLAAAYLNPNRETIDALFAHVKQFGGLHTYINGEIGASAFGAAGITDPEAQVAQLPVVQEVKDEILAEHLKSNTPIDELYQAHNRKLNRGE